MGNNATTPRVTPFMESIESAKGSGETGETGRYGPEVLCASWNPQVTVVTQPAGESNDAPAEGSGADAAGFLARFYRSQRT